MYVCTCRYGLDDVSVLFAAPRHVHTGPQSMVPPQPQLTFNQETANSFSGSYPSSSTMMDGNSSSELWCWCTLLSSPTCMYVHELVHLFTQIFIYICTYICVYIRPLSSTYVRMCVCMHTYVCRIIFKVCVYHV